MMFVASLFLSVLAFGADGYLVTSGSSVDITEHSVCRRVTNTGSMTRFVPTKSSAEWSSFSTNPPANVTAEVCPPSCGGASVGGSCWYLSADGASCTTTCASHGGYNEATRTYVGDTGTNANCNSVLTALGAGATTTSDNASCNSGAQFVGCFTALSPLGSHAPYRIRCINAATTEAASYSGYRRACACHN